MNDKRQLLIEASVDLFSEEGFWNTPTAKIAKQANVAKGTLFNYFETKEELIECVYLELVHEYVAYIREGWPEDAAIKTKLEHVWYRTIDWGLKYPERYKLISQLRVSDTLKGMHRDRDIEEMSFLLALEQEAREDGLIEDISPEYFRSLMRLNLHASIRYAERHQLKEMQLVKHIAKGFEIFWKGIAK
ncbi:MAG: TetR/AcrR family transcriptional regulator [Chloroflexota bacterium]